MFEFFWKFSEFRTEFIDFRMKFFDLHMEVIDFHTRLTQVKGGQLSISGSIIIKGTR